MTREEAIKAFRGLSGVLLPREYYREAIQMAISALQQPEIIRCKDCKHRYVDGDRARYNVCDLRNNLAQSNEWFCADAERKEVDAE